MIDWSKQNCGVHKATYSEMIEIMPDIYQLMSNFPEDPEGFIWDVKVHMLMPNQFPCIPNWHYDNVPRDSNGVQDFSKTVNKPMYLWVSGTPLPLFRTDEGDIPINPEEWIRFTQKDYHTGTMSKDFCWRGFIRATHKDILSGNLDNHDPVRRHSQVYLDSKNFNW